MTESSQVSNLEKFNNVYEELEEDIRITFKSLKVKKSDNNLEHFIVNVLPFMDDISCNNVDAFRYKHTKVYVINGVRFSKLLSQKEATVSNLKVIWKYLQTLYVLAFNIEETMSIVGELSDNENYDLIRQNLEQINYTAFLQNFINSDEIATVSTIEEKPIEEKPVEEDADEGNNSSGGDDLPPFLQNSLIGSLAKEISDDLGGAEGLGNPADLLGGLGGLFGGGGGGDNDGLGKLVGKVVNKLQSKVSSGEFDESALIGEASNMMQHLNLGNLFGSLAGNMGGMGNPASPPEAPTENAEEVVDNEEKPKKKKKRRRKKKKKTKE